MKHREKETESVTEHEKKAGPAGKEEVSASEVTARLESHRAQREAIRNIAGRSSPLRMAFRSAKA
ncbi:MAG: hypothetical protein KGI00_01965 [Candidatus Micrarchaeota archaeon]|nr:hypothetical protein [Candidatus Micrarchaeota archaeon]MDE1849474.1 hypothetical protein [Candidatus Micrarchaeota archaeon]